MSVPTYTVKKVAGPGSAHSLIHWSGDAETTSCGREVDENWEILTNTSTEWCNCVRCMDAEDWEQF